MVSSLAASWVSASSDPCEPYCIDIEVEPPGQTWQPAEAAAQVAADFVVDVTPPNAHESVALAAFDAGLHVLGEKPFANTALFLPLATQFAQVVERLVPDRPIEEEMMVRAKIEARKFLATVSEYADFRRRTGFLWPRLF